MPNFSSPSYGSPFRGTVTPWVRWLLIANTAVFGATLVLQLLRVPELFVLDWLGLQPGRVLIRPWTVVTYAFVHAGVFHWFFNMIALFFFGPRLEERWGGKPFIKFYLVAALGGALFSLVTFLSPGGWVVGASGAINGLLMAWAIYWPDDEILLFGVLPIRIKWLVIAMGFFSLFSAMGAAGGGVAHLAHLGGFAAAFAYLKSPWAPNAWGDLPARRKPKKQKAVATWSPRRETTAAPAPAAAPALRRAGKAERELLDDVDRILDKISAQGLSSLTPEERARLDEVSKRYRTN
jgi:membrane associated rhomboid family serine protease